MNLTSLVTGPARAGIALGKRALDVFAGRATQALGEVRRRVGGGERELDDVTLARKVEAEIFRSRRVAKGKVDVNVAGGVVWLRGEAGTPELIATLEAEAAAIPEVKRVENLLHLPRRPPVPPVAETEDAAITHRVETELFREGFAPKGKITVRTSEGVVVLRGEADSADRIRELEAKAAAIPEVKRVENQLRLRTQSPPAPFPHGG